MQNLVDLYLVYTLVRKLTTPFTKTPAYALGIIDDRGNVLRSMKSLTTPQEKKAWTYLDILVNNLKRLLAKIPGGQSQLATYAAALYLLREPVTQLREAVQLTEDQLHTRMFGSDYLAEALLLSEDVPAMAAGNGQVAGIGIGKDGEPGVKLPRRKFMGCEVFDVESDVFQKCRLGKKKYARYKSYVGEGPEGDEIRDYGRKNLGAGIIVADRTTGAMTFLRRPGKY